MYCGKNQIVQQAAIPYILDKKNNDHEQYICIFCSRLDLHWERIWSDTELDWEQTPCAKMKLPTVLRNGSTWPHPTCSDGRRGIKSFCFPSDVVRYPCTLIVYQLLLSFYSRLRTLHRCRTTHALNLGPAYTRHIFRHRDCWYTQHYSDNALQVNHNIGTYVV